MQRRILLALALLTLSIPALVASAQATDVTPKAVQPSDLQQVTVGKLTYSVDPYNVFVCFPIATNQQWTGQGVTGNTTVQCFDQEGQHHDGHRRLPHRHERSAGRR
jgi:hypothetical protein